MDTLFPCLKFQVINILAVKSEVCIMTMKSVHMGH